MQTYLIHVLFINVFSTPIKGRSQCYGSLHCEEYGRIRTCHIYNTGETLYKGSKPCSRAFITVGKQTNHAKSWRYSKWGYSKQAHVFVIYW